MQEIDGPLRGEDITSVKAVKTPDKLTVEPSYSIQ